MQRLIAFSSHHPYLIAAAILIILLFAADELSRRLRKYHEVGAAQAVLLINRGALIVDIRPSKEFTEGHVIGARNIPLADLEARVAELDKFKEQPVIICCELGQTSHGAAGILVKHRFTDVRILKGGVRGWRGEPLPLERS